MLFTFWEGAMPAYIEICLRTWKLPFTMLNYENLHNYTDLPINQLKQFTLAQQADCVRVHVLRDNGGYWLDADTLMLDDKLPEYTVLGDDDTRINTIGFLHTEPQAEMFIQWAKYQDQIIANPPADGDWSLMGNAFTDEYLKEHREIKIGNIYEYWLETEDNQDRYSKYLRFYFGQQNKFNKAEASEIIMLHNSWTPKWYKELSKNEVLVNNCTLSDILRELI